VESDDALASWRGRIFLGEPVSTSPENALAEDRPAGPDHAPIRGRRLGHSREDLVTVGTAALLSRIAIAWLITLPVTILVAAGLYYLLASPGL
jgi:hypothetical protein